MQAHRTKLSVSSSAGLVSQPHWSCWFETIVAATLTLVLSIAAQSFILFIVLGLITLGVAGYAWFQVNRVRVVQDGAYVLIEYGPRPFREGRSSILATDFVNVQPDRGAWDGLIGRGYLLLSSRDGKQYRIDNLSLANVQELARAINHARGLGRSDSIGAPQRTSSSIARF